MKNAPASPRRRDALSAVLTRPSGPDGNGPGCSAAIRAALNPPNPPKLKFLAKLIGEQLAFDARQASQLTESSELSQLVGALQSKAGAEEWSERKLAAEVGLPRITWQRLCRSRDVDTSKWLPRLRHAARRLQVSCNPAAGALHIVDRRSQAPA